MKLVSRGELARAARSLRNLTVVLALACVAGLALACTRNTPEDLPTSLPEMDLSGFAATDYKPRPGAPLTQEDWDALIAEMNEQGLTELSAQDRAKLLQGAAFEFAARVSEADMTVTVAGKPPVSVRETYLADDDGYYGALLTRSMETVDVASDYGDIVVIENGLRGRRQYLTRTDDDVREVSASTFNLANATCEARDVTDGYRFSEYAYMARIAAPGLHEHEVEAITVDGRELFRLVYSEGPAVQALVDPGSLFTVWIELRDLDGSGPLLAHSVTYTRLGTGGTSAHAIAECDQLP